VGIEVVKDPAIIFLDEPTTGLDSEMALGVITSLKAMAKAGKMVSTPFFFVFPLFICTFDCEGLLYLFRLPWVTLGFSEMALGVITSLIGQGGKDGERGAGGGRLCVACATCQASFFPTVGVGFGIRCWLRLLGSHATQPQGNGQGGMDGEHLCTGLLCGTSASCYV
jgi:hypothetical protein